MAPPVAFTIPFFLAYRFLGLIDSRTGLVVIYLTFNLALVVWMMRNCFDGVPRALEEAAWIDGCGVWSGLSSPRKQDSRLAMLENAAGGLAHQAGGERERPRDSAMSVSRPRVENP
jgi:hypothetical protein